MARRRINSFKKCWTYNPEIGIISSLKETQKLEIIVYVDPAEIEYFRIRVSKLDKTELQKKRESLTYFMKSMEKSLPYADGRSYYDDLNEIAIYQKKIGMIDEMLMTM